MKNKKEKRTTRVLFSFVPSKEIQYSEERTLLFRSAGPHKEFNCYPLCRSLVFVTRGRHTDTHLKVEYHNPISHGETIDQFLLEFT